ncbi:MAG TPA: hypothetical protein GX404_01730 [Syntrophomonadaceae bacterium]|nr:hypothetical protein [Syntrophomonadaceae bacterium]
MLNYNHLLAMTDDIGMLQFSVLDKPDPNSGYTIDDNARALIVALMMGNEEGRSLANQYLDFMVGAQRKDGTWYNMYLNGVYSTWNDSDDCTGRAFLSCCLAANSSWSEVANKAYYMLRRTWPSIHRLRSPRAIAYTLLGLSHLNGGVCHERQRIIIASTLAQHLIELYKLHHDVQWHWFEDYLTYCNGILPHGLFAAYRLTGDKQILKIAYEAINFLISLVFEKSYLIIVGNDGWLHRGREKPLFDQQPVDAASTALACYEAYKVLGKKEYLEFSQLACAWYSGSNIHNLPLRNEKTGGCYDALTAAGVNLNQGAEAVLSLISTDLLLQQPDMAGENIEKSS